MKIKESSVEFWNQTDTIEHIARCARVCYASENTNKSSKLVENLWHKQHRSMFRHAGVYYIIPKKIQIDSKAYIGATVKLVDDKYYVSTNVQAAREYWDKDYSIYKINKEMAFKHAVFRNYNMLRITLCINTGIDITREYNRKSPNNIAEQSTRYVDFNKKIGIVFKKCHWMYKCNWYKKLLYMFMAKTAECFYKISRSKYGLNLPPEDARWILPLDTMSKAVYTYTIAEWKDILNMRLYGITGKPHSDAKEVAKLIKLTLKDNGFIH